MKFCDHYTESLKGFLIYINCIERSIISLGFTQLLKDTPKNLKILTKYLKSKEELEKHLGLTKVPFWFGKNT